ncbi:MAG: InlB B-repeat-containing protein [Bacteroidales bacterium]|nr:InlB B-repeat-containing protein [Bacteroidales bacterium]
MVTMLYDTVLTAIYAPKPYTITYVLNGGVFEGEYVSQYLYKNGVVLPKNAQNEVFSFAGWYETPTFVTQEVSALSETDFGDKVYYAKWIANDYSVMYNTDGGSISGAVTSYTYGYGLTLTSDITKNGYTFAGWYDNEKCEGNRVYSISITDFGNKEYWAKWTENTYNISYEVNNGTIAGDYAQNYVFGHEVILPTSINRDGYEFMGWYVNSNYDGDAVLSVKKSDYGNKTYYAKWSAKTYSVLYRTDGGTVSGAVSSYVCGNGLTLPSDAEKTGHTFGGWYENEDFSGDRVYSIPVSSFGDKEFFAKWTKKSYNITFVVNGGKISEEYPNSYAFGTETNLPVDVSREGYTFKGWYVNSNFDGVPVEYIDENDYGNKVYWARWIINNYEISASYDILQGYVEGLGRYEYNSEVTLIAHPDEEYEFVEWRLADGEIEQTPGLSLKDSIISLTAKGNVMFNVVFKQKEQVYPIDILQIDTLKTEVEVQPIDITGLFKTSEGTEPTYSVKSSSPNVVSAIVQEGKLFLTTFSYRGKASIIVTAKLPNGEKASLTADVIVEYNCEMNIAETITNVSCYGESDGKIELTSDKSYKY